MKMGGIQVANKIRVLIVNDRGIVRDGIRLILNSSGAVEVCGESDRIHDAMELMAQTHPDVVLLDFKLEDGDAISACSAIKARYPGVKIVILTDYSQNQLVIQAIRAGADAYLLKTITSEELIKNIVNVYQGASVLDPSVTHGVLKSFIQPKEKRDGANLSTKETYILQLLSLGKSNKEIAEAAGISEKTVRNYISNIFKKLNVSNRTEAAGYWIRRRAFE